MEETKTNDSDSSKLQQNEQQSPVHVLASPEQSFVTQIAVNATALVDSADAVLLPAVFRAFELEFHVGPSTMGNISLCQALCQSISSPFWGYLSDTISRRNLLSTGCLIVAVATMMVSQAQEVYQIAIFRGVAGLGLAIVGPIAQSLIADLVQPSRRGLAYGLLGVTAGIGSMGGIIFASSMSTHEIWGMMGWRVAFMIVSCLEILMAVMVLMLVHDPPRGLLDEIEDSKSAGNRTTLTDATLGGVQQHNTTAQESDDQTAPLLASESKSSEQKSSESTTVHHPKLSFAGLVIWARLVLRFFRIRTFVLIVIQGLCGTLPWSAMVFMTLYLQYLGFSNTQASSIFAFIYIGTMCGTVFGGLLGDKMASWSPNYGRVLTAQVSVLLGIPFVICFFHLLPRDNTHPTPYILTLFIQGFVSTWNSAACNRPILSEIVHPSSRSSVFAVLIALEGAVGAFGAPVVGYLAEQVFGYKKNDVSVAEMSDEIRDANLNALANSATTVMIIPWILCFALYGALYITYPIDRFTFSRRRTLSATRESLTIHPSKKTSTHAD